MATGRGFVGSVGLLVLLGATASVQSVGCIPPDYGANARAGDLVSPPNQGAGDLPLFCTETKLIRTESGSKRVPLPLPDLLSLGAGHRDSALAMYNTTPLTPPQTSPKKTGAKPEQEPSPWTGSLVAARECYSRALVLAPDDYESELNLGVIHAISVYDPMEPDVSRRAHIGSAKRHLGRAYMTRRGSYEAVYFLALVALAERDYAQVESLLAHLERARVRPAAVLMLRGRMAEQRNEKQRAEEFYRMALNSGASDEISGFLLAKVKKE